MYPALSISTANFVGAGTYRDYYSIYILAIPTAAFITFNRRTLHLHTTTTNTAILCNDEKVKIFVGFRYLSLTIATTSDGSRVQRYSGYYVVRTRMIRVALIKYIYLA